MTDKAPGETHGPRWRATAGFLSWTLASLLFGYTRYSPDGRPSIPMDVVTAAIALAGLALLRAHVVGTAYTGLDRAAQALRLVGGMALLAGAFAGGMVGFNPAAQQVLGTTAIVGLGTILLGALLGAAASRR